MAVRQTKMWVVLENIRLHENLTEEDWRKVLNVPKQTYTLFQKGAKDPSVSVASRVSKAFNISLDFLFQEAYSTDLQ
jgi:DNA-binding XRE family transcriptional regulator